MTDASIHAFLEFFLFTSTLQNFLSMQLAAFPHIHPLFNPLPQNTAF